MADPATTLRTGLADRYRLERELSRGGMARVYLAQDLKHDRPVALKVLHPYLSASLGAERFLREVRTAARLQHPNILPVFDSGAAGQRGGGAAARRGRAALVFHAICRGGIASGLTPGGRVTVTVRDETGKETKFPAVVRLNSAVELDYYRHGGILQCVLRQFMGR